MGYYIETNSAKDKAAYLIKTYGAKVLPGPRFLTGDRIAVCVVDNGPFEAAAVAFSEGEVRAFNNPTDDRPKVWLDMSREQVYKLCPYVKAHLEECHLPT